MEAALETIKNLADRADATTRRHMIDGLRKLSYSLETPDDTLQRLMYAVCQAPLKLPYR